MSLAPYLIKLKESLLTSCHFVNKKKKEFKDSCSSYFDNFHYLKDCFFIDGCDESNLN